VLPELAPQILPLFQSVLQTGRSNLDVEVAERTDAEGRRVWQSSYFPVHDAAGTVEGVGVIVQDITDRKKAEKAVQDSDARYRAFLAHSREGIWRYELDKPIAIDLPVDEQIALCYQYGYLAECNDAMARMYGFEKAEDIMGIRMGELLPQSVPRNIEYLRA